MYLYAGWLNYSRLYIIVGSIIVLAVLVTYIINISLSYGDLISTHLTTEYLLL